MGTLIAIWLATMIYIERAQTLSFDEARLPDAKILRGDVVFRHDSAYMYCDSAYFYEATNSMTAMGHVRFEQGDSLMGRGQVLYYDGNTKIARLRRNCSIEHRSTILTTDSCNYDRARNVAYYYGGGRIVDTEDTLTSVRARYYPNTRIVTFRDSVHLINRKFVLDCDTLRYNTETHRADLISPTQILYEGQTTILSSLGWYNTKTEMSELYDRSTIHHHDGRFLTADTIRYDKSIGYGQLLGNLEAIDSTNYNTLSGNYGELWEVDNHGYATDRALLIDWSDSIYTYLHADTLFTEDLPVADSLPDSVYHRVRGYYHVRLYREDVQLVCDSVVYNGLDSVMTLYRDPVCWNENNQMSADTVRIYIVNGEVDHMVGINNAITIQHCLYDSLYYNQMTGKQIEATIIDGEMRLVDVSGNAETVFYPEDDTTYVGMNVTQSSFVRVYMKDKTVERVRFTSETTGTLYPLDQIPPGKDRLTPFFWATVERPTDPQDVFRVVARTERPKAGVISATMLDDENDLKEAPKKKKTEKENRNRKSKLK